MHEDLLALVEAFKAVKKRCEDVEKQNCVLETQIEEVRTNNAQLEASNLDLKK